MIITSQPTENMHSHHLDPQRKNLRLFHWLHQAFKANAWLTIVGLLMIITLVASCVGLLIDHRMIAGAPAWAKPAKFAISFSVYCFTFVWLLSFLQRWKKLATVVAGVTSVAALGEMGLIVLQVVRGVRSHFNITTPFDALVYRIMGSGAMLLLLAAFVAAILLLFERRADRALVWSLRLGLAIMLFGMYAGYLMTQGTPAQLAAYYAGHATLFGAHSVGVPDGGPGLPFLGWNITGGDLRIAHFVGLHALQVLPFIGWFLSAQRFPRWRIGQRVALVWTISLGYLGLVASLLWQALRGQSLIAPDGLTLLTWGLIAGFTLVMSGAIILHVRESSRAGRCCPCSYSVNEPGLRASALHLMPSKHRVSERRALP